MSKKKDSKEIFTTKIELPNGITLLVREDHSTPIISMASYFIGGRRIETRENNGISALFQRTLTKGVEGYDARELAEEAEMYGISLYPFYGADTAGLRMKSLSRHFDRGLDLFFRILLTPVFPEEEFVKEQKNLIDDIVKEQDDLPGYSMKVCRGLVFEDHPYGFPLQGTEESVGNLTAKDLAEYHKRVFSPGRMVLSFVGDIEAEEARNKIEKHLSGFTGCGEVPDLSKLKKPIKNVREKLVSTEKQQVAICIGFQAPSNQSEDFYTFRVLNQVLSGMGSRLFVELRDKLGLAYSVNSIFSSYLNSGIFQAYILNSYGHKERARLSLLEEVDRLRTRLVSYDELVRSKRYHLGLFDIGLQKKSSIASNLAYYEIMGLGHDFIEDYPERIKRITRQKVKRAAEKYLKPQCYAISILTPATFPKNLQ